MKSTLFLLFTFFSMPLFADCIYNDTNYEEGTIINGYICTSDGTWKYHSD